MTDRIEFSIDDFDIKKESTDEQHLLVFTRLARLLDGLSYNEMSDRLDGMVDKCEIADFEIEISYGVPDADVYIWLNDKGIFDKHSMMIKVSRTLDEFEKEFLDTDIVPYIQTMAATMNEDSFRFFLTNLITDGEIEDFSLEICDCGIGNEQYTHEVYVQETSWTKFKLIPVTLKN